jgi:hypothetical protein
MGTAHHPEHGGLKDLTGEKRSISVMTRSAARSRTRTAVILGEQVAG